MQRLNARSFHTVMGNCRQYSTKKEKQRSSFSWPLSPALALALGIRCRNILHIFQHS
jgi:hypothetical protein